MLTVFAHWTKKFREKLLKFFWGKKSADLISRFLMHVHTSAKAASLVFFRIIRVFCEILSGLINYYLIALREVILKLCVVLEFNYQCSQCKLSYVNESKLEDHIAIKHPTSGPSTRPVASEVPISDEDIRTITNAVDGKYSRPQFNSILRETPFYFPHK